MDWGAFIVAFIVTSIGWCGWKVYEVRADGPIDRARQRQFLEVLSDGQRRTGFDIALALRENQKDVLMPTGAIYATMQRLEDRLFVTCTIEPHPERADLKRFYYTITSRGQQALAEMLVAA